MVRERNMTAPLECLPSRRRDAGLSDYTAALRERMSQDVASGGRAGGRRL